MLTDGPVWVRDESAIMRSQQLWITFVSNRLLKDPSCTRIF